MNQQKNKYEKAISNFYMPQTGDIFYHKSTNTLFFVDISWCKEPREFCRMDIADDYAVSIAGSIDGNRPNSMNFWGYRFRLFYIANNPVKIGEIYMNEWSVES